MIKEFKLFLVLVAFTNILNAQNVRNDTIILKIFDDVFSLMVSDDESTIAVLNGDNYIEIFQLDSMIRLQSVKVSRNAWLKKAFFYCDNSKLYYDYGVQAKTKYKMINIETGVQNKVDCLNVPKGCTYHSLKLCGYHTPVLSLKTKPFLFKVNEIDIILYQIKN